MVRAHERVRIPPTAPSRLHVSRFTICDRFRRRGTESATLGLRVRFPPVAPCRTGSGASASVVQRQDLGLPFRGRGFDPRRSLPSLHRSSSFDGPVHRLQPGGRGFDSLRALRSTPSSGWSGRGLLSRSSRVRLPPGARRPRLRHTSPSASRPRHLGSQPSNAGSNPAGDTKRSLSDLVRSFSLSRRHPSTGLRSRSSPFDSEQGGPVTDRLRSGGFQTQASEACRPGFDSRRGLRRKGRRPTQAHALGLADSTSAPATATTRGERRLS